MTDSSSFSKSYNPDVLCCLANLSSDEVFTPPDIANAMLDLLPQELFQSPDTKFLDPCCKSGVFLREIAKRLIKGLEPVFPDLQERLNHIFKNQLYGIAITTLTSLISRRSLYCSKDADCEYSVVHFDSPDGNIRFSNTRHVWKKGRCVFCGASKDVYDRESGLETHAYELIHLNKPEELFDMKFDVIIGNPPYQMNTVTGETTNVSRQAKPIYNLFVEQAKKLNPRFLCMIIPSRWFAGGLGLDAFRQSMMEDNHITHLTDYTNAKDCFPQNSISGGVCYFLWERDKTGLCQFTNINGSKVTTECRSLSEFPVVVRYNSAVDIIRKVARQSDAYLKDIVSPISPFGIPTKVTGASRKSDLNEITLYTSKGVGYTKSSEIRTGMRYVNKHKVMVSQIGAEHAGEPGKDGRFRVLTSSMRVLKPYEVCTNSYIVIGEYDDYETADNILSYLRTKFVRFLVLQAVSSIHISKTSFTFVPVVDFSRSWSDEDLYVKFGITQDEIEFIDSMIKPMEGDD